MEAHRPDSPDIQATPKPTASFQKKSEVGLLTYVELSPSSDFSHRCCEFGHPEGKDKKQYLHMHLHLEKYTDRKYTDLQILQAIFKI